MRPVILMIDDEESLLECMREVLEMEGFTVLTASDGKAGLEVYMRDKGKIDLIICDKGLPELDGEGVFFHVRSVNPGLPFILATGSIEISDSLINDEDGNFLIMYKPYKIAELVKNIGLLLNQ